MLHDVSFHLLPYPLFLPDFLAVGANRDQSLEAVQFGKLTSKFDPPSARYQVVCAEKTSRSPASSPMRREALNQADRSTLPAPENPDRAAVYVSFHRGRIAPEGAVELHLTAGFNDRSDGFVVQDLYI